MATHATLYVTFTSPQWAEFHRAIAGHGGGQQFVRRMQQKALAQLRQTGRLTLAVSGDDAERWLRYRDSYGDGGFQQRLRLGSYVTTPGAQQVSLL